jgi:hypothetical protein
MLTGFSRDLGSLMQLLDKLDGYGLQQGLIIADQDHAGDRMTAREC